MSQENAKIEALQKDVFLALPCPAQSASRACLRSDALMMIPGHVILTSQSDNPDRLDMLKQRGRTRR